MKSEKKAATFKEALKFWTKLGHVRLVADSGHKSSHWSPGIPMPVSDPRFFLFIHRNHELWEIMLPAMKAGE
jgi:hypothetical protein